MGQAGDKQEFAFQEWKDRGVHVFKRTPIVMEELEVAQMNLQTMLTMRHVAPFRSLAHGPSWTPCHD